VDAYLRTASFSVELIVANDGSDDDTARLAREYAASSAASAYRVLDLPHRGKAATVRDAMLAASGEFVMFTDADLSTPMEFVTPLIAKLRNGADIAIGTREGAGARRLGEPAYRHIMGRLFNAMVRLFAVPGISDTQCGFKGFKHAVAADLFSSLRVHGHAGIVKGPRVTGFDVELLFLARKRGYRIVEVPVHWKHVSGSKVDPLRDSFRMLSDVVRVRWTALRGGYDRRGTAG
jgi:glycosyltransferase involved in cell wall biosynthesis